MSLELKQKTDQPITLNRREFIKTSAISTLALKFGLFLNACSTPKQEEQKKTKEKTPEEIEEKKLQAFRKKTSHLNSHPLDEKLQSHQKHETLKDKSQLFHDHIPSFYNVGSQNSKKGETISTITKKLLKHDPKKFSHLTRDERLFFINNKEKKKRKAPKHRISLVGKRCFNYKNSSELPNNTWIPLPLDHEDREISDLHFAKYCLDAIEEMEKDQNYENEVQAIITKLNGSKLELTAIMLALAKLEAGGHPLGKFSLHLFEKHLQIFSYTYFHILLDNKFSKAKKQKWPGQKAKENLDLSIGETYHPKNAAKLFLGYLIEKMNDLPTGMSRDISDYFPLEENYDTFSRIYNGHYKKSYAANLERFHNKARSIIGIENDEIKTTELIPIHRGKTLRKKISNALKETNFIRYEETGQGFVKTDQQIEKITLIVLNYLQANALTEQEDLRIGLKIIPEEKLILPILQIGINGNLQKITPQKQIAELVTTVNK